MSEITAQMVMELRQKTGSKMMDAKRALVESNGDMAKATDLLREKGQADAAKRSHRTAAMGAVVAVANPAGTSAALAEVNCETDFVAKTDAFVATADAVAGWVLSKGEGDFGPEALAGDVEAAVKAATAKTGENIQFARGVAYTSATGVVASYVHLGGKIGVLVQVDGARGDAVATLAKDLAMHVAAASPEFLVREGVSAEATEREMEIYRTQARNEGKPEAILDRIAAGKLEKYYKDNCLLDQAFVKDPDKNVAALLAEVSKAVGAELKVVRFARYQLGQ